ncbi:RNA-directed DNA polymerase-like protein [Gossypium australe]|uniref:RNA-directed DNA polymerase-like protein n=1 Tax=Gossypium australe TaxID=47621 RepID=A0A5B6W8I9_9ROSI|nr:RNA-directed DNA polymerase-like protein [Gossypium australe]
MVYQVEFANGVPLSWSSRKGRAKDRILTNAPTTFCTLMNKLFILMILLMYSKSFGDHVEHLREVFQTLRENKLHVKEEKCSFTQRKVSFLGHIAGGGKIWMDESKIQAIVDWEPPTKVTEFRFFLRLVNYN